MPTSEQYRTVSTFKGKKCCAKSRMKDGRKCIFQVFNSSRVTDCEWVTHGISCNNSAKKNNRSGRQRKTFNIVI